MSSKSIVFNLYPKPTAKGKASFVYANDPVLQLDEVQASEGKQFPRNAQQQAKLAASAISRLDVKDPVFGASLDWACRGYIVQQLSEGNNDDDQHVDGHDDVPNQAISRKARRSQLKGIKPRSRKVTQLPGNPSQCEVDLYLFNVLVAFEWLPDEHVIQQLQWAFRRASDFLYDVTDGCMAFGQVVFGGREWMECADIIVMASNHLHPRSWVSGLLLTEKYLPIRIGRGMWHRRNQVTIPWDEPESYRTLIHEWGHYALGLRDEYLESVDQLGGIIIPGFNMVSTSIMATLEGTSELVPHADTDSHANKSKEWKRIDKWYPGLKHGATALEGPGRLPLPLPRFHNVGTLQANTSTLHARQSPLRLYPNEVPFPSPTQVNLERCWVYVLQQKTDGMPQRLLAQGTLDARSQTDGFPLFGAVEHDTIMLFHERSDSRVNVLQGTAHAGKIVWKANATLTGLSNPQAAHISETGSTARGAESTPDHPLRIAVIPHLLDPQPLGTHHSQSLIRIRIQTPIEPPADSAVWVFPLGQLDSQDPMLIGTPTGTDWLSEQHVVPTLDGHVLVKWGDQVMISTFSQGGGPPYHTGLPANPITAGSSDGNILLFFHDEGWKEDVGPSKPEYAEIKVTTALLLGTFITPPDDGQLPLYTYSLGSSAPLPQELTPTLTVFYDPAITSNKGDLQVYRLNEDGTSWTGLETYHEPFSWFAAVPLNMETASKLVDPSFAGPRVEYYRLGKKGSA